MGLMAYFHKYWESVVLPLKNSGVCDALIPQPKINKVWRNKILMPNLATCSCSYWNHIVIAMPVIFAFLTVSL